MRKVEQLMKSEIQPEQTWQCTFSFCRVLLILAMTGVPGIAISSVFAVSNPATPTQSAGSQSGSRPAMQRVTRLVWQDRDSDTLKWADLQTGSSWSLTPAAVSGFPKLDVEKQDLVQMEQAEGILLVGVRDSDGGKLGSGWVAVDSGVRAVPHGNHSDWKYLATPSVRMQKLNTDQGNPAHLYVYNDMFYLANDAKNGFTYLSPKQLASARTPVQATFCSGGGGHITLAAAGNTVCYSTWIDAEGPNRGRVDVISLQKPGNDKLAYSLTLPTGVIHGATANSGRVFFAPADGVCWVNADLQLKQNPETARIGHISLGKDEESGKPFRTGAFANHRNWVLFTTGSGADSAFCLLDAKAAQPNLVKLKIDVKDGLSLVTPEVVLAAGGKRYAFLFQDKKDGDIAEKLTIVDLDPNGDRDLSDAKVTKTLETGPSRVEGHSGHHSICFDGDGRFACFTNPGDGTIWVISLSDLEIRGKLKVGGTPGAIAAFGSREHHH